MIKPNFNTLSATQKLRESGIAGDQAEAIVSTVAESQTDLATKDDLARLSEKMERQSAASEANLSATKSELKLDMANMKHSILMHIYGLMGGVALLLVSTIAIAVRYLGGGA